MLHLDRYILNARVLPMLVVAFPLVLAAYPWVPAEAFAKGGWGGMAAKWVTTGACATLLATALSFVPRAFGTRLEERLWRDWGGAPATAYLRYAHPELDARQTAALHAKIAVLDPSLHVPSAQEEAGDPAAADQCYAGMVRMLRARTWGPKNFPMLFDENVSYGFRRNLLAMRPYGILASLIGMGSGAAAIWLGHPVWPVVALSALVGMFIVVNNVNDLRRQADRYTRRLFETVDLLKAPTKAKDAKTPSRKKAGPGGRGGTGQATV
ncbi:hypothetical protein ASF22_19600 [Methylobacterium sp. Leaf87]|uniref:hypothetical protein n=1 Tax=Methylobacterium sp. Leaf87 TaxID=1736243 RepID=UPI0006FF0FE2|nr:hypothetical protein [Methylobacterium sp. Leaf87]KQO68763.1 hypothetical protein ASF22_19600 [Methylobacterium sp. Leaf87]